MEIIENDFKLVSSNDGGRQWDLYLLYTVKPRGGEAREELQLYGYGLSMYNALRAIAHHRLERKKEVYTLKEYMKDYKETVNKLCKEYLV